MTRLFAVALLIGCAVPKHWPARPAEHPPTKAELAAYELTVQGPPDFADDLRGLGFKVVPHPPYRNQLEVRLDREGDQLVGTLRSDGFFVDEALGPSPADVARTLAVSQRVADFIRNSGLPQQHPFISN